MKEFIEKIVERVEKLTARLGCWNNDDGFDTELLRKEDVLDIIHEEATAHNDGWIPCSERLPELNEVNMSKDVLISFKDSNTMRVGFYDENNKKWFTYGNCPYIGEAIAWKPIAPYQPKGE